MALINIETAIKLVLVIVRKIDAPAGVEILTYKRNRGVSVMKLDDKNLAVQERGYEENEFQVTVDELAKLLKSIAKREFPRSRKVRIYQIKGPDDLGQERKKI
ncbi:MAG: hypothetical protein KQH63_00100 [Desulfobulbaceae bacterium]|nr:hypothetical protein [Desulfobulbaceae bacterium]